MIRLLLVLLFFSTGVVCSQIPADRILGKDELIHYLKTDVTDLLNSKNSEKDLHDALILYLHEKLKTRFYFNGSEFKNQFKTYQKTFPKQQKKHLSLAEYHTSRYAVETQWQRPYKNLLNDQVTAYELRHIARQQKSSDMALMHYYQNQQSDYIDYFSGQVASLN